MRNTYMDHSNMHNPPSCEKKTRILATIGPACMDSRILKSMIEAGMDAARINTAHGDFAQYRKLISLVRESCGKGSCIPIMIDIKGPEIRFKTDKEIVVKKDSTLEVGFDIKDIKNRPAFSHDFFKEIDCGDKVFFDNGLYEARVMRKNSGRARTNTISLKFEDAAVLKPNKGVNVPNKKLKIPSLSKKDKESVRFAIKENLQFIALSFARDKEDVEGLRRLIKKNSKKSSKEIGIISKIENWQGIENIDEIIDASDGIMIARGDLGVEIPQEKIPYLQKMMIVKANQKGKISIVATQMLETMTVNQIPTRAEISDVANAVLDSADALMLSGETAGGKHPIKAVKVMASVCLEIEDKVHHKVDPAQQSSLSEEMSTIAVHLAKHSSASKIVCITRSGYTARLVSRFRPRVPIIAVTDDYQVALRLRLVRGITPMMIYNIPTRAIIPSIALELVKHGILSGKDTAVFLGGIRTLREHVSNMIEIHVIKDLLEYTKKYVR